MKEIKQCKIHGETLFVLEKRLCFRCVKCRSLAVTKRRQDLKLKALLYKGNKCLICGYNKCISALEFHHRDPKEKDFHLGQDGHSRSWERIKKEIDKCDLLCANCHREEHDRLSCL